jgi:hypothetical protein
MLHVHNIRTARCESRKSQWDEGKPVGNPIGVE